MPTPSDQCRKVTAGELGRLFGVSRKHIYTLVERGLPRDGRLFDVAACFQWQFDDLRREADSEPENLQEARLALYLAQTEKLRLENAKMARTQVDIEEAKSVLLGVAAVVAGQLDALGPRLAPQILGLETLLDIQESIFAETRAVRAAIAREISKIDPDSFEDHPAPAPKNRRPMGGRKKRAPPRKSRARTMAK